MALRRPPTRIELKDSDIAEYDEVREWDCCECCFGAAIFTHHTRAHDRLLRLLTNVSLVLQIMKEERLTAEAASAGPRKMSKTSKADAPTPQTNQKPSAAERIGITRPR